MTHPSAQLALGTRKGLLIFDVSSSGARLAAVHHEGIPIAYAFRDRRARKGEMRRLWIQRINAACRQNDMSYSRFIAGMNAAGIEVDRKILAEIAVTDAAAFAKLVENAKAEL